MNDSAKRVFGLRLFERKAGVLPFSLVGKQRTPIRVEADDLLGNRINKLSKLRLALPNPFVRQLALGNIANSAGHQHALLGLQLAEADLHRKLTYILVQAVQFQPRPQWPS